MVSLRAVALALAAVAATAVSASSISEYYDSDCTGTVNTEIDGSTPNQCNTQTGASIGWTLDSAKALTFYSDTLCQNAVSTVPSSATGCSDFPATGGSWLFN